MAVSDQDKLQAILSLCEESRNIHRDTLEHYVNIARQLAAKTGSKQQKIKAELAYADMHFRWGWIDSALAIVDPVLASLSSTQPEQRDLYFSATRQKAIYFAARLKYPEALELLYRLVAEAEKYNDSLHVAINMNSIGSIALQREAPRTALSWLQRAYANTSVHPKYEPVQAAIFTNMAEAYSHTPHLDSARWLIQQAVNAFTQQENLSNLAHALQRQSNIYIQQNKIDSAEYALRRMIEVRTLTNDGSLWLDDNLALIDFYLQTGQATRAITYCKQMLERGNLQENNPANGKIFANNINLRLSYYEALARCYKHIGDQQNYQTTLERIITAKDSFYLANSAEAIAEVQTKYEVQKKENTIIQQQLSITRKNSLFYLSITISAFIAIISFLLFTSYRKRQTLKTQMLLEREKAEAEERERKRIAADLHDNLGAYAASIASNLDMIELKSRSSEELNALQELRNNSQAIVAQLSDTIWALNKDALPLTAICDRVKIFMNRLKPSYPHIQLKLKERIYTDISFAPTQAYQLFRIIQEAVVNALKHSEGTEIVIAIEVDDSWKVQVMDNGAGMKGLKPGTGGNGLGNMRRRAEAAGWQIFAGNSVSGGFEVSLQPM